MENQLKWSLLNIYIIKTYISLFSVKQIKLCKTKIKVKMDYVHYFSLIYSIWWFFYSVED